VWLALAKEDIGDQHKRTTLGPLWLLLNYLAFAGTFIFVFRRGEGIPNYEAYVAVGLLVWFYLMETLTQSVSLFVREEGFIKGTILPLSVYVMRLFTQTLIRSGYAVIGCLAILLASGFFPQWSWGLSLIGVALILLTAPAAIILFGLMGVFFPDCQFIISNLMRIGMFLTPVFWTYTDGGGIRSLFYNWNPFTYFIEIVRAPILYGELPMDALGLCLGISLAIWLVALVELGRHRREIVFVI
jgi:lipopolysaccharide transport system permease protein